MTLSLEAPDGAGSREVFYLSLGPGGGLDDPQGAPAPEARLILTEDRFFYGGRQPGLKIPDRR
ncbi:hypothetical protein IE979_27445 [Klebsiella pneumoniae]|uniref:Uncharacterized protein n=1 Tax=Klebsiella pneumoniae TaxID=573 RepID=A0A927DS89_KLEPN|nr:hypothetical protein [Klebsiella pneumoniae]